MLKHEECDSSFPIVHPCKPDKDELIKDISYSLMSHTEEKSSIITIPCIGQNEHHPLILKEVFAYPRSSIQTIVEKGKPSENIRYSNVRSVSTNSRKQLKKNHKNETTPSQSNSNIVQIIHEENPTLKSCDNDEQKQTNLLEEKDSLFEVDALMKEIQLTNFIVSQYKDLVVEVIEELHSISSSLQTEESGTNKEVAPDLPEDINLTHFEVLLSNVIYDIKSSVIRIRNDEKDSKYKIYRLLKDNERYEKQSTKLKKALSLLLKKIKKSKEDRHAILAELSDIKQRK